MGFRFRIYTSRANPDVDRQFVLYEYGRQLLGEHATIWGRLRNSALTRSIPR